MKADAYGLGVGPVAGALWEAGCQEFFVASVAEGVELREILPDASISVFNGAMPGTVEDLTAHDLVPLLISAEQVRLWHKAGNDAPFGLHFDTGMNRTGIPAAEIDEVAGVVGGRDVRHILSHLASSDERESDQPDEQLTRFREIRKRFPGGTASLANSGAVFRGDEFHFDLVRPGICLYGGTPIAGGAAEMMPTIMLEAPIVQLRDLEVGERVGYGATYEVATRSRHAVVTVGYADGFLRSASNAGSLAIDGQVVPIIGRVSMDLTIIDVTEVPDARLYLGAPVELIGDHRRIDDVAAAAGTIANELLTTLGRRYERVYEGG